MPVAASTLHVLDEPPSTLDTTLYYTVTFTGIIACLIPLVALMYIAVYVRVFRFTKQNPKALNKAAGRIIQRCAPFVYIYLLCISVIEVAFSSWLVLQYQFNQNSPSDEFQKGTTTLLFTAGWTTILTALYAILFMHPTWSVSPISSVGAQITWVFVTLLLWIISHSMIAGGVPFDGTCDGIFYCSQVLWMYALCATQMGNLAFILLLLVLIAWMTVRDIIQA